MNEAADMAASFAVVLLFAAVHIWGGFADRLAREPRSTWLSAAGGISVAYVFVHILPELAAHQQAVRSEMPANALLAAVESHVYVAALVGLVIFYGLDAMLRRSAQQRGVHGAGVFWIHLGVFALYNVLVGYILVHREERGVASLLLFAFAIGLHFIINDQALRTHHGQTYHDRGRWLLAAAPPAGWLLGIFTQIGGIWQAMLFALLAGSVILTVLKEELPEDRESRFWAFAGAAAAYSALLLVIG
jgi:hypothetical protein